MTGWGEVAIDVVYENKTIRRTFYVEEVRDRVYQVTFTPQARGKHRVYIYLNGMEVDGYQNKFYMSYFSQRSKDHHSL